MIERNTIVINSELDIIEARMHVRKLARDVGLDLFDQARISLATSTMAIILGLEKLGGGSISLAQVDDGERAGVQVVCVQRSTGVRDLGESTIEDARRMVDELGVASLPGGIAVTLIKWAAAHRRRADRESGPPVLAATRPTKAVRS